LQVSENERQLEAIKASTSWRLTAPLRVGGTLFPGLRSFGRRR
jgi:hypothetical protein